ncbi:hypothetical protein [Pararhodospirillum photometricum]|uniref:Uncharacterized protein n=1 Tax=Pararhodospirillum photometricum DSM 122 TaxID=1150469 RepID=H6SSM9_PARPM|nr:hypothetical protein [Pararhodospirillum photometricum]CCG07908.1 Putative uncharacterized protein [Pararhodospirillum photometricum DSM 122]CCG08269.1 Putative uncharacterized protein [Pararhodospirillum photometricum DSM 122]
MKPVRIIGMAWFRREDWPRVRDIMEDADALPATYEKWLYRAEKGEKLMGKSGVVVKRAYIDPETFPDWCAAHSLNIDAQGRTRFAADWVRKEERLAED